MEAIDKLINVVDRLLGPNGCPWDQEQTMLSTRAGLMEETCELIDAIDSGDGEHILEELGDLLFNVIFLCRLAEKEGYCNLESAAKGVTDKLIYRHPHVFGTGNISTSDEVREQWDKLKATEKGKDTRKSVLDGIPKALPALARAQKVLKKMLKQGYKPTKLDSPAATSENEVGNALVKQVIEAQCKGIEAELALRIVLDQIEKDFRSQEELLNR